jgi:NADH:quinone reductase (non-electrogenic)
VVVGAGFGGLAAARHLRGAPVDVILIDANNFNLFTPLLYQVATAGLATDDIAYALRGLFRRQRNIDLRMARVTDIDLDRRVVNTDVGDPVEYDTLVLAIGAVSTSFGVAGVDEHALQLKSLDDAVSLRNHVLRRFEEIALDPAPADPAALDVVVCGGGPTGVELAGALIELYTRVLAKDFPHLDVARARVVLIEAADRLLGTFTPESGERALRTLTRRGVEVRLGVGVAKVADGEVALADGTTIRAGTIIWAAGVRGHPLGEALGLPMFRGGRIVVGNDLAVPGHPEVFAVGDIAANPYMPLAQVALPAMQGGKHVAEQIGRRVRGLPTEPFHFHDLGTMATIGRHEAVAEFPSGLRLAGPIGWLAWLGLHIVRLLGVRNRASVLVNWVWNYLTYDRGSRLITEPLERDAPVDD